jgi:hypothetical protein
MEEIMNKTKYTLMCFLIVLVVTKIIFVNLCYGTEININYKELRIKSESGVESDIAFFDGGKKRAVIFAPGASFSKESWYFLAERFQEEKIASVSLNTGSATDVLNGIDFLKKSGFEKIALVGGSVGGVGVLEASNKLTGKIIDKIVVIAPFGGNPIKNENISKLFIVAEDDMMSSSAEVYRLFDDSSDPKTYKEFSGSNHAQRLFETQHKETLIVTIIDFIKDN